jgi:hypothetical protein
MDRVGSGLPWLKSLKTQGGFAFMEVLLTTFTIHAAAGLRTPFNALRCDGDGKDSATGARPYFGLSAAPVGGRPGLSQAADRPYVTRSQWAGRPAVAASDHWRIPRAQLNRCGRAPSHS